jgi:hypothetical protein
MRKRALSAIALVFAISGTRASGYDGPLDFTLENRLGVTIVEVYVSPHMSGDWGPDRLEGTLGDRKDFNVKLPFGSERSGDIWDLKIVTFDGTSHEWKRPGFDLTQISKMTLFVRYGKHTVHTE